MSKSNMLAEAASSSSKPAPKSRTVASSVIGITRMAGAARSKYAAITSALCDLAAKGEQKSLTRFLEVTPNIANAIDGEAYVELLGETLTPLAAAVGSGDDAIVAMILAQSPDVNKQAGPRQLAPLHLAVSGGCRPRHDTVVLPSEGEDITRMLLNAGADAAVQTDDGSSPLHFACALGELECAAQLLETEGGRESLGFLAEGMRVLTIAALRGDAALVEMLLASSADPNGLEVMVTSANKSALQAQEEQREYDEILESKRKERAAAKSSSPAKQGKGGGAGGAPTAAQASGAVANPGGRLRIQSKVEADVWPLYMACRYGHTEVAALLLEAKASPHAERRDGSTALHVCSGNGHVDCVRALLAAGAEVKNWDVLGVGPLFVACTEGDHDEVVKILLGAGAPVEGSGNLPTKLTPLMGAALEGHERSVELLLAAGANIYQRSYNEMTALDLAVRQGHQACTVLLEEAMSEEGGAPTPPGLNRPPSKAQVHRKAEEVHETDIVEHPLALSPARRPRSSGRSRASPGLVPTGAEGLSKMSIGGERKASKSVAFS